MSKLYYVDFSSWMVLADSEEDAINKAEQKFKDKQIIAGISSCEVVDREQECTDEEEQSFEYEEVRR